MAPLSIIVSACALFAWLIVADGGERAAEATVPGANGKIAFERSGDILVINPDGGGIVNLTNSPEREEDPAWSPDGTKIAFSRAGALWGMDADGSNLTQLTSGPIDVDPAWSPDCTSIIFAANLRGEGHALYLLNIESRAVSFVTANSHAGLNGGPAWSPDGTKIAHAKTHVLIMNPDGSGEVQLSDKAGLNPSWSPDGTQIAFRDFEGGGDIYSVRLDGTHLTNLTNSEVDEDELSWSPDGTQIAYTGNVDLDAGRTDQEIWVMAADGTGQTQLTFTDLHSLNPDWQPLVEEPVCAALEFVRPAPSITPTSDQVPSGLPSGGGNPDSGPANLPLLVAGAGLLVISFVTWYAGRRWIT